MNFKFEIDEQFSLIDTLASNQSPEAFYKKLTWAQITTALLEEACPIKMIDVEHTAWGDFTGGANITHLCYESDSEELLNETRGLAGVSCTDIGLDFPLTGESH